MTEIETGLSVEVVHFPGGTQITYDGGVFIEWLDAYPGEIWPPFRRAELKKRLPSLIEALEIRPGTEAEKARLKIVTGGLQAAVAAKYNPFVEAIEGQEDY